MCELRYIGEKVVRKDGREKATGALSYMADLRLEDMLFGAPVHPNCGNAVIESIEVSDALRHPGVVRVVTAADIPGLNRHGLIFRDQPVLCDREVRYRGDTVAVVVAETEEAACSAARLVKVNLKRLPEVRSAGEALRPDAPSIHEGGNLAARYSFADGDAEEAFTQADAVVEETFVTQYQEHAYLETEGGVARPLPDGGVEVWEGCQNGNRAAADLGLILGIPTEKVLVHSHPLGGGFGGKDDLTLQGILAVCALACGRAVKISFSREESFLVSPKRMPMEIRMKMAARADGTLLASRVRILGTCGAYACYGPAILSLAIEHACGMYVFPNVDVAAKLAYTNGPLVSAFRGFGNVQMNFAVESMMDMLAERLRMDPIQFRRKNALRPGVKTSYGYLTSQSVYADEILHALACTRLWREREEFRRAAEKPWLHRGVGIAACFQGVGLGNACIPDRSAACVELLEDGGFLVRFGNEDMGQGSLTALLLIAAEVLQVPMERLGALCGRSGGVPDSGATTASKTTYITGWAVRHAAEALLCAVASALGCAREELVVKDSTVNGLPWTEIFRLLPASERAQEGAAEFQTTQERYEFGVHFVYTYLSQIAGVEVNTLTGEVRVLETALVPAAGRIINRLGYEGQCEGGALMSQGYALLEEFSFADGAGATRNLQTYLLPTFTDLPEIELHPIEDGEETGPFGANGIGEPTAVTGTAAILNAVYDAVGIRITDLPCKREKILLG